MICRFPDSMCLHIYIYASNASLNSVYKILVSIAYFSLARLFELTNMLTQGRLSKKFEFSMHFFTYN